ncbi:PH domain-containing protein [Leekyejoonella antrihumi]|uniref:Low molecular weight protein antigen 6 PH domain-containing protein n=1 Tax=Leekyejoonella antrihumi TaxID=1660198 RepID=A0A563DT61_9MICO|nr:PH domain-containing protein [Leekyejoonella antrihumi]TWP33425.1 hypothetical protein FGL98_21335 [Leekyejoonella antrihumi]
MPHHRSDAQPDATTRRVFRQPGAHITGWAFIGCLTIACAFYLANDPSHWFEPIGLSALVALVVWVVLVRPAVVVAEDGVELRNLVRDVSIPWTQVDLTTRRWNLKIYTQGGDKYGAWAISQQRPRRGTPMVGEVAIGGMRMHGSIRNPPPVNTSLQARGASAESVGTLIDQTKEDYDNLVAAGELTPSTQPIQVRPAIPALAAIAVAVVLAVVCAVMFG